MKFKQHCLTRKASDKNEDDLHLELAKVDMKLANVESLTWRGLEWSHGRRTQQLWKSVIGGRFDCEIGQHTVDDWPVAILLIESACPCVCRWPRIYLGSFVIFTTQVDDPRYLSASEISFLQWQLLISIYRIFCVFGARNFYGCWGWWCYWTS